MSNQFEPADNVSDADRMLRLLLGGLGGKPSISPEEAGIADAREAFDKVKNLLKKPAKK